MRNLLSLARGHGRFQQLWFLVGHREFLFSIRFTLANLYGGNLPLKFVRILLTLPVLYFCAL